MMQPPARAATPAKVANQSGQTIPLHSVRSVLLPDIGWQDADNVELTYQAKGSERRIPFTELLGFSDQSAEDANSSS